MHPNLEIASARCEFRLNQALISVYERNLMRNNFSFCTRTIWTQVIRAVFVKCTRRNTSYLLLMRETIRFNSIPWQDEHQERSKFFRSSGCLACVKAGNFESSCGFLSHNDAGKLRYRHASHAWRRALVRCSRWDSLRSRPLQTLCASARSMAAEAERAHPTTQTSSSSTTQARAA
jgi:hypothetical protein